MRKTTLLWLCPPWQGLLEGWLVSALMLWATLPTLRDAPALVISMLFLLVTGVCAGWAGARIRLRPRFDRPTFFFEILVALTLTAGHFAIVLGLMWFRSSLDVPLHSHLGETVTYAYMALCIPAFLAARGSGYFLRFWNQLRARRYVWGLTHSLLTAIALTGAFVILTGVIVLAFETGMDLSKIPSERLFSTLVIWTFTLFFLVLAAGLVFLAVFSLPSFALSYWMARRMTRRIESLSLAAKRMRAGDLSVRVNVEGEDEMAALQASFNAMAENLQHSTRALQTERDTVAGLLKIQRDLAAGISHELRTPAAVILAHSESLLAEASLQPCNGAKDSLEAIAHEAGRLQGILTDMLTLSQTQAGHLSLRVEPVAPRAIIEKVLQTQAPLAWNQKRVQICADLPATLTPVLADAGRLEQVLVNLIQNGLRHTPPGGVVVVSAHDEPNWICLEVADSGVGIAADDVDHIWEPFFRGKSMEEELSHGFGLGLSLVREMVEAMGGTVGVQSTPGDGACFQVRLPLA